MKNLAGLQEKVGGRGDWRWRVGEGGKKKAAARKGQVQVFLDGSLDEKTSGADKDPSRKVWERWNQPDQRDVDGGLVGSAPVLCCSSRPVQ